MPITVPVIIVHGRMKNHLLCTIFDHTVFNMAKAGRPKKPAEAMKGEYLEVRVDTAEKEAFRSAAEVAGLPLSSWVRERLRRVAKRELQQVGQSIPFLSRLSSL